MAMTYASLGDQMRAYANLTNIGFIIEQIPNLINQGLNRIYREVPVVGFQTTHAPVSMVAGQPITSLPNDWKETLSIAIVAEEAITYLEPKSYESCTSYWRAIASVANRGQPLFYADYIGDAGNMSLYFAPTPDRAYLLTLTYLQLPLLSEIVTTNYLTKYYPEVLLYSCLVELFAYLNNPERKQEFEAMYQRGKQGMLSDKQAHMTDRTIKRDQA